VIWNAWYLSPRATVEWIERIQRDSRTISQEGIKNKKKGRGECAVRRWQCAGGERGEREDRRPETGEREDGRLVKGKTVIPDLIRDLDGRGP